MKLDRIYLVRVSSTPGIHICQGGLRRVDQEGEIQRRRLGMVGCGTGHRTGGKSNVSLPHRVHILPPISPERGGHEMLEHCGSLQALEMDIVRFGPGTFEGVVLTGFSVWVAQVRAQDVAIVRQHEIEGDDRRMGT